MFGSLKGSTRDLGCPIREFQNMGVPYFGVLRIRILRFRVLDEGPLSSETPI